jgi:hypothetical protein
MRFELFSFADDGEIGVFADDPAAAVMSVNHILLRKIPTRHNY